MKNITLEKDKLVLFISILKIISIFYVIPLYSFLGIEGSYLYAIGLGIIFIFMSLSTGLSSSVILILEKYDDKKILNIYKKILYGLDLVFFLLLLIFSDKIAILFTIFGDNNLEKISLIIKFVSFYILLTTPVDIYREYLSKKNLDKSISNSKGIDNFVKAFLSIILAFIGIKLNLEIHFVVGLVLLASFISSLCSCIYTKVVIVKYKDKRIIKKKIDNKILVPMIIKYSIPFIILEVFKSLSTSLDLFFVPKALFNNYKYSVSETYQIFGDLIVWSHYLNELFIIFITGIIIYILESKKYKDISIRIKKSIELVLFIGLPIIVILSILSNNIWTFFYGGSNYGPTMYAYYVFLLFFYLLFILSTKNIYELKNYKLIYISLLLGLLANGLLKLPLMYGFYLMGLPAFYGAITSIFIGYLVPIIIFLIYINNKYKVNYENSIKTIIDIFIAVIIMAIVLIALKFIISFRTKIRIINLIAILIYSLIGAIIYLLVCIKNKTFEHVIGDIDRIVSVK